MDKFVKLGQDMVLLWSKYKVMYWAGIWNTLKLAFLATLIGCFIGLLCGVLNTIPYTKKDPLPKRFLLKLLRIIIRIYVEVFRGTPMVLQSVFIYYGLPYFSNNALRFDNIFAAALLIVAINTGAYMAESVRGGIMSVDTGQTEGAKAIGMNHFQTMVYVILPQAVRNIMPQIGNNFIINWCIDIFFHNNSTFLSQPANFISFINFDSSYDAMNMSVNMTTHINRNRKTGNVCWIYFNINTQRCHFST